MQQIKRADWVTLPDFPGIVGVVQRIAKDGSWADVKWPAGTKRMPMEKLIVQHTITVDGWEFGPWQVTDITRKKELGG